ncbi:protein phosphatase 2C domain-containing protein [Streptomyces megasporus]|uniref:protein phosphatase 2C domain-containing protein n=1 Tax=Streptomyces megasporus TaxID=44060 RepID=UPI0004E1CB5E|nr:protein phosphatase 2C domain-containing protein [Streptomyces megasporus]
MSRQGENAGRPDWWGRLYDGDAPDTGRAAADDSVDERFDSAAGTVGVARTPVPAPPTDTETTEPDQHPGGHPDEHPDGHPDGHSDGRGGPDVDAEAPTALTNAPGAADSAAANADAPGAADTADARPAVSPAVLPAVHEPEPAALPAADPDEPADLPPDTVLEEARHGSFTLRAASLRGAAARERGEPRRDALLTARFGAGRDALVLVAVATGPRAVAGAHRAAREISRWVGSAVGHSHTRLVEDIRAARRDDLKSGLHRLTGRGYGRLRARAAELGLAAEEYTADLRCLLLPADPECRVRVFFGVGSGGLFRLRDGRWQDIDPGGRGPGARAGAGNAPRAEEFGGGSLVPDPGPAPAMSGPFRFRASLARPGDTLLLCSAGLAAPMRDGHALADRLAERWSDREPPGPVGFLADAQSRIEGHTDDRTAVAVWEH